MKRREGKAAPSADLLVCFPTRAHLTLMPKPICSPARPSEPKKNSHNHQQHRHNHHLKKSSNRGGASGGHVSPFLWSKTKQMGSDISEPTSPKVTCAGQIKVRPRTGPCKNWQSVMEEIERLHNHRKEKKRPSWVEALGFKKEIMQFLTCLRSVRFDFRCLGSFPNADITTDDEEEDEFPTGTHEKQLIDEVDHEASSRAVFSKWFMVLQENKEGDKLKEKACNDNEEPCAPPSNALLLMRCRSAPAKSWLEEREEDEDDNDDDDNEEEEEEAEKLGAEEAEKETKRESLMQLMRYETDFYKFSCDIAKETWVVGGIKDPLSRSRSWKR